jgi:serine protease AprX
VASYSSRGPVGSPDDPSSWELKPDLVAPGNAVVAAAAVGSWIWNTFPERRVTGDGGEAYLTLSGSSQAAAVVSGAVAQLLQARPDLTPDEVKFALQYSAEHLDGFGLIEQGAGSLNVPLAVAVARSQNLLGVPKTYEIAGERIAAGQIAFANTMVWGSKNAGDDPVNAATMVWGSKTCSNTMVWGSSTPDTAEANTMVWGSRSGDTAQANTMVWGSSVCGNTMVWGSRSGDTAEASTMVWGSRSGDTAEANTMVWGSRTRDIAEANTMVWGS